MKEFEKWYNQFDNTMMSQTETRLQQRSWRAALEWILEVLEIEEPYEISHARIKEELKD